MVTWRDRHSWIGLVSDEIQNTFKRHVGSSRYISPVLGRDGEVIAVLSDGIGHALGADGWKERVSGCKGHFKVVVIVAKTDAARS
jgi:hypothetical protein